MSSSSIASFLKILESYKRSIVIILIVLIFSSSAIGIQRTLLSIYTSDIDDVFHTYLIVGSAIALCSFAISKAIGNFLGGRLCNLVGRKSSIIIGTVVLFAGSIIIAFISNIVIFFLGNFLLGSGVGIVFSASTVFLTDVASADHRAKAVSLMELSVYGGTSLGSIMAGLIAAQGDFNTPFVFSIVVIFICVVASPLVIDVTRQIVQKEDTMISSSIELSDENYMQFLEKYKKQIQDPLLFDELEKQLTSHQSTKTLLDPTKFKTQLSPSQILIYLTGMVSRISDTAIILVLPLLLLINNFSPVQIGIITSLFTISWAIGIALAGFGSDKIGRKIPLVTGLILELIGILAFISPILNRLFFTLIMGVSIAGIGRGLYYPIPPSIIADYANPFERSEIIGTYRFLLDSGYVFGSLLIIFVIEPFRFISGIDTISLYQNSFVFVVVIILLTTVLNAFFLRDPRPGYSQISEIKKHFEYIDKSFSKITESIIAISNEETESANNCLIRAKSYERDADNVLHELIQKTYVGSYRAPDAFDLVNFSSKLDKALGHAIRASRKLGHVKENIATKTMIRLVEYSILLEMMVNLMGDIISFIPVKITIAAQMTNRISLFESLLDEIYLDLWSHFGQEADELSSLTIILIKDILESLEKASNTVEDASEIIQLISFKRQL